MTTSLKFRFSNIDCVESELRLLMTGVSFSVRRPNVNSRRGQLYAHSLTFQQDLFDKIEPIAIKTLAIFCKYLKKSCFFKVVDFFLKKQESIACWKISKTSFMLLRNFIFRTIKKFYRMMNRKKNFFEKRKFCTFHCNYLQ